MGDIQDAINSLADDKGTKGEVWVAKGTYVVTELIDQSHGFTNFPPHEGRHQRLWCLCRGGETRAQRIAAISQSETMGDGITKSILKANGFNRMMPPGA